MSSSTIHTNKSITLLAIADPTNPQLIAFSVVRWGVEMAVIRQVYEMTVASFRWEVIKGTLTESELDVIDELISKWAFKSSSNSPCRLQKSA